MADDLAYTDYDQKPMHAAPTGLTQEDKRDLSESILNLRY